MKVVAKLLFKIFLCLAPLWCIMAYVAFFPENFGHKIITYNLWHKKMCRSGELKKYKSIALGDSVANGAYVPDYLSEDFINLSIPQSTPVEDYFVLLEILKIHTPSTIFISFMDHHMFGSMNGLFTERMFSHRFDFRTEFKIMNNARKHKDIVSMFPKRYIHSWLSHRLYLPPVFMPSLLNANFNDRKKENKFFKKLLELHRGTFVSRYQGENTDNKHVIFKSYQVSGVQEKYYTRILKLCEEKNIKVKIVILPLNPKVKFTDEYIKQKKDFYEKLERKYSNVEVVWPFVNLSSTDFTDTHHMNIHGSFKFSTALRDRFKDIFPASEQLSERTIMGREDYLRLENEYSTLLARIEDPFYAIVYNPAGNLVSRIVHGDLNVNGMRSYKYDNLFLLNTDGLDNFSLNSEKQYIEYSLGEESKEIGKSQIADIHIAIINKKKNKLVTEKRFVFKDNGLKAVK